MKKLIGYCGVDSGQILICDPCYIDSQWKHEEFTDVRRYEHLESEMILEFRKDFKNYDEVIKPYGKNMNQMIEDKEVKELSQSTSEHPFSYNACCKKTLSDDYDGQLNYEMGHPGVGVVSGKFGGDGYFPVYANIDEDGLVTSITIKFFE